MADAGNMTLTYVTDATNSIKIRSDKFAWSFTVVAPESHAREHRAMYPHQRGLGQFMIQGKFMTYREYRAFMDFLRGYARSWLHPPSSLPYRTAGVTVSLQRGEYSEVKVGVPIRGITDGDHVGQMGYNSPVVFQEVVDPLDPTVFTGSNLGEHISYWTMGDNYTSEKGGTEDDTTKFFYPFSKGSEDSNVKADDIYGLGSADKGPVPTAPNTTPKTPVQSFLEGYSKTNPVNRFNPGLMGN